MSTRVAKIIALYWYFQRNRPLFSRQIEDFYKDNQTANNKLISTCLLQGDNQRTEGPESRTDGETLIFWDW